MLQHTEHIIRKLEWMQETHLWPNGVRYLWTDAMGVVLLVSLYQELGDPEYLETAEWVAGEVDRVLGRNPGFRIGEEPERHGQYFHYNAMWLFALRTLGLVKPEYLERAIDEAREMHPYFVLPGSGVYWKMREDLTNPEPGYGFGALDHYHGYVIYSLLDPRELAGERAQMQTLIEKSYRSLQINQDLGLGIMLWLTHFFPRERWAKTQRKRSLGMLEKLWADPPGYFARELAAPDTRYAFTNYGVLLGLQAQDEQPDRVRKVLQYFNTTGEKDAYADSAITHVMECVATDPGMFLRESQEIS